MRRTRNLRGGSLDPFLDDCVRLLSNNGLSPDTHMNLGNMVYVGYYNRDCFEQACEIAKREGIKGVTDFHHCENGIHYRLFLKEPNELDISGLEDYAAIKGGSGQIQIYAPDIGEDSFIRFEIYGQINEADIRWIKKYSKYCGEKGKKKLTQEILDEMIEG